MKNHDKIDKDIEELSSSYILLSKKEKENEKELKNLRNRFVFLEKAQNYLEYNPSEEYLKNELLRLKDKKESLDKNFMFFKRPPNTNGSLITIYNEVSGLKSLKKQIEFISYLLEN